MGGAVPRIWQSGVGSARTDKMPGRNGNANTGLYNKATFSRSTSCRNLSLECPTISLRMPRTIGLLTVFWAKCDASAS